MRYAIEDIPVELELGDIVTRGVECGELYARHISLPAGTDFTPLLAGLPGDVCPSAHWGQILEGSMTVRYADGREETNRAGDVYYWPAGHTGWTDDGATFTEWSPTSEILPVLDHIAKKVAAG